MHGENSILQMLTKKVPMARICRYMYIDLYILSGTCNCSEFIITSWHDHIHAHMGVDPYYYYTFHMPSMCVRCTQVHNMISRTDNSCMYGSVVFLVIFFSGIPYLPQDLPSCLPHAQQHWVPCASLHWKSQGNLVSFPDLYLTQGKGQGTLIGADSWFCRLSNHIYMSHEDLYWHMQDHENDPCNDPTLFPPWGRGRLSGTLLRTSCFTSWITLYCYLLFFYFCAKEQYFLWENYLQNFIAKPSKIQ